MANIGAQLRNNVVNAIFAAVDANIVKTAQAQFPEEYASDTKRWISLKKRSYDIRDKLTHLTVDGMIATKLIVPSQQSVAVCLNVSKMEVRLDLVVDIVKSFAKTYTMLCNAFPDVKFKLVVFSDGHVQRVQETFEMLGLSFKESNGTVCVA